MPQNRQQVASGTLIRVAVLGLLLMTFQTAPVFAGDLPALHLTDFGTASLSLTPAQQQKLTALENASHAQAHALVTQIHQLRQKLSEMYETYCVDVASVRRTNQDLNHVQGQLLDLRLSEQLQMRKILSSSQFTQLQAAIRKHEAEEDRHPEAGEHHDGDSH